MDHDVELLSDWHEAVGHAGALIRAPNGLRVGGFDPRSNGGVSAFWVVQRGGLRRPVQPAGLRGSS